jgi:peptide chain release factor 1
MRNLASEEYDSVVRALSKQIAVVFPGLLVPRSTTAHLSALVELKSGVGGSESSLFLGELLRMYIRLAHTANWRTQILASNEVDGGGTKDAIVEIKGAGSYDALRWESGVHRVQRIPTTEASGRVHTSTVAVLVNIIRPP